jgi:hypothetical protein
MISMPVALCDSEEKTEQEDLWILKSAIEIEVEKGRGMEVVFLRGSQEDVRAWAFPALPDHHFDAALDGLKTKVGQQVTGLINQWVYLRIDFANGGCWIIRRGEP